MEKFKSMKRFIIIILLFTSFAACKEELPLDLNQFKDLLLDMHRTDGILSAERRSSGIDEKENYKYYNNLYKKYGINKAEFDECMLYYSSEIKEFSEMYDDILDSLNRELTKVNRVMKILKKNDTINLMENVDTIFLTKYRKDTILRIDSLKAGNYKFKCRVRFDSTDKSKNNMINSYFLALVSKKDSIHVRDTIYYRDTTYIKKGKPFNKKLKVKDTLQSHEMILVYDTLFVRKLRVLNDTINRSYNWSQYVDSTYSILEIHLMECDKLKKLKHRDITISDFELNKVYTPKRTLKFLKDELKRQREYHKQMLLRNKKKLKQKKNNGKKNVKK